MNIEISVKNHSGQVLSNSSGVNEAVLVYEGAYNDGDIISVNTDFFPSFVVLQLDHSMAPCFCFLKQNSTSFMIRFNEKRISYALFSFSGTRHYIHVRVAALDEIQCRKNLAYNPYDSHENTNLYPHSKANVETRGESVFASRNAIDGYLASSFHGEWPYTSWGINRDPDAELELDFGRPVIIDEIAVYLRTDFPHDAWWEKAEVAFSDGSNMMITLKKISGAQSYKINKKKITSLVLKNLIKADDPSPFPALTQIQVFGTDL